MRRIALIATLLASTAAWVTTTAGADDSHTYHVEMYNAFGLVKGSDVRIAGVNAGSVTDLGITRDKRAMLTIETSGPLGTLGKDTQCSSEPQSLIAEYFLTCNPKGPPLSDGGTIPASQVHQTVQADLVQNTLREPFKDRLQLIINEFGTALAGNPQDLNEAIQLGAPALEKLKKALDILASENATIRDLNANSDTIITQLANRKEDVVRFIQEARDTAAISAERRADLSTNFDRLDNFLHQLHPTLTKLGDLAEQQTPLLADLRAAAPGLNTLAVELPAFNKASERSLTSLGRAAGPGKQALKQGKDEIQALAASGKNAFPALDALDKFLLDIASPKRTVEIDERAANTCAPGTSHPQTKPCYSTGRPAPTGYTGMEAFLNWAYYQAGAVNQFDQYGHLLHFSLFDVGASPCGPFNTGGEPGPDFGVPNKDASGTTTNANQANACVAWLGKHQPGINEDPGAPPYEKPYNPAVCSPPFATSSQDTSLCNPSSSKRSPTGGGNARSAGSGRAPTRTTASPATGASPRQVPQLPENLPANPKDLPQRLQDLLGIGGNGSLPDLGGTLRGGIKHGGGGGGGDVDQAANDLLDFLFSP
jgi:virulence factor Mce-like protein